MFFGAMSLIMYLVIGAIQWSMRDALSASGYPTMTALSTFLYAPVVGCILGYLTAVVAIAIYNFVAKKYPISWEVKK